MRGKHILRFILIALPILTALEFAARYSQLPPRVASHFGLDGLANGWMSKEAFAVGSVTMMLVMAAIFGGIGPLLTRLPNAVINLPKKEFWLAPERRDRTLHAMANQLLGIGILTLALLALVFHLCLQANLDGTGKLSNGAWLVTVGYLALVAFWVMTMIMKYSRAPATRNEGETELRWKT